MQRNKVHSVTIITAVAQQLGIEEDLLHEMSVGMEPEDGVIWVYGLSEGGIIAFSDDAIDDLRTLLDRRRKRSGPLK
jgi:hypothetical protein